jgi:outer membrane protein assembly factor BamB
MPLVRSQSVAFAAVFLVAATPVPGGDWPQILGPERTGAAAADERIFDSLTGTPNTLWEREVGSGFAGVAVADGIAVLFHRVGNTERVEGMDGRSGDALWKADFPARYRPSFIDDDGPRCVPLVHSGRVYLYGAQGGLYCLDLKSGRKLWQRDTFEDYSSKRPFRGEPPEGYFGVGAAPVVAGDKLLVNVGGDTKDAGIVAFDLKTGKTVWTSTAERASYSAPVVATVDGTQHALFVTRLSVVSLDPADGSVRFQFPFNAPGPKVSGAAPLVLDGHLFVSASYEAGAVFAKIEDDAARILWRSDDLMSSQYTTCVRDGDVLYGIHGRQDIGVAALRCFNPKTRKLLWEEEEFGYATLIKADGKLLIMKTDGELVLAGLNPRRFEGLGRARLLDGTARALPALADGRLYVRDEKTLKCVDLRKGG